MIIKKSRVKYNFKKLLKKEILSRYMSAIEFKTLKKRTDTSKLEFD